MNRYELLKYHWAYYSELARQRYDIPAHYQIFGHIIHQAEIEGILYPSKLTACLCLAIFPKNFVGTGTDSYLKLDDEAPHEKIPAKIDATNWRVCDLETKEIID